MKNLTTVIRLCMTIGIVVINAVLLCAQDAELIRHFDYDQKTSLSVKEIGVEHRGDTAIHDITYSSPKGGLVPAYLVVPKGKGPFAAVILGHWDWGNSPVRHREEVLGEGVAPRPPGGVLLFY